MKNVHTREVAAQQPRLSDTWVEWLTDNRCLAKQPAPGLAGRVPPTDEVVDSEAISGRHICIDTDLSDLAAIHLEDTSI
jgi:hypothetical protein